MGVCEATGVADEGGVGRGGPQCGQAAAELTSARGVVRSAGEVVLACWHAETDTLPWVRDIVGEDGQPSPQRWLYADTFDQYDSEPDRPAGSITYRYPGPSGPQPGRLVEPDLFDAACRQDHDARSGPGGDRVIWHDDDLDLAKTIGLDGRRITVTYRCAPPGHQVSNEFSVDLRSAMTGRGFQTRTEHPATGTATSTGARGGRVTITPGPGCHLSPASLVADLDEARRCGMAVDFLRCTAS